jgi:hypothetical protein
MHEVPENRQRVRNDLVRAAALDVHDKTDTAGVVFVCRVIETLLRLVMLFQFVHRFLSPLATPSRRDFPHRSVFVFSLASEGLAQIRGIRSFARENHGKSGAKGAKSIPACRGRFNGTRRKRVISATE